jgi:phage I-like protein
VKQASVASIRSRITALGAVATASPLELANEQPPTEFRIFRAGANTSDKGTFIFDDDAAEAVMSAYAKKASTLTMDYEHQALADPPIEAPASCYSWTPEVRNGELWATNVKWTPRASGLIAAREYTRFSPAFFHDPKTMRVQKILNVALTNVEALDGIEPLMAASATSPTGDRPMAKKMQCKACLKALKAPTDDNDGDEVMCTACGAAPKMLSIVGLKATATDHELVTELSAIAGFRTQALALTGQASLPAALGTIEGWKKKADGYDVLAAESEKAQATALRAELTTVLDNGAKEGKVPGVAGIAGTVRASLEKGALGVGGGKPSREGIEWLTAIIAAMPKVVSTEGATAPVDANGEIVTLTAGDKELAKRHGWKEENVLKAKKERVARNAAMAAGTG